MPGVGPPDAAIDRHAGDSEAVAGRVEGVAAVEEEQLGGGGPGPGGGVERGDQRRQPAGSASVSLFSKQTYSLVVAAMPALQARANPLLRSRRSTRTSGYAAASAAAVPSVEPSSTTRMAKSR